MMADNLKFSRVLNLTETPSFLAPVQPLERVWWRILVSVVLGILAIVTAMVGGLALSILPAGGLFAILGQARPLATAAEIIFTQGQPGSTALGLIAETAQFLSIGLSFTLAALGLLLVLKAINRRPMRSWITAAPRFRWRLLLAGLLLFLVIMGLFVAISAAMGDPTIKPPIFNTAEGLNVRIIYAVVMITLIPLAAAFEEVLCRGWMMQLTSAFSRNLVVLVLVNGVIFSALHLDPDAGRNLARLISGVVFSYAALRLGGLEFSIGVHAANNLAIALFQSTLSSNLDTSKGSTAVEVLIDIGASLIIVALVELVVGWKPLSRLAGLDDLSLRTR